MCAHAITQPRLCRVVAANVVRHILESDFVVSDVAMIDRVVGEAAIVVATAVTQARLCRVAR